MSNSSEGHFPQISFPFMKSAVLLKKYSLDRTRDSKQKPTTSGWHRKIGFARILATFLWPLGGLRNAKHNALLAKSILEVVAFLTIAWQVK